MHKGKRSIALKDFLLLTLSALECASVNPLKWLVPSWKAICSKQSLVRAYHPLINFVKGGLSARMT